MTAILLMYILVGAVAGVLAGLLGIGGGLVIVPMLVFCFVRQGIPDAVIMHLALGTSLASIMFTAVSSFRAHHRRGAVHWDVVRKIVIGIFSGTFFGSYIAAQLSTPFLKGFFVVFLYYVAVQMLATTKNPNRRGRSPAMDPCSASATSSASFPAWWASAEEPFPCRS